MRYAIENRLLGIVTSIRTGRSSDRQRRVYTRSLQEAQKSPNRTQFRNPKHERDAKKHDTVQCLARRPRARPDASGGKRELDAPSRRRAQRGRRPERRHVRRREDPSRPIRRLSDDRSISISTHPAMPADAVSPAAPHIGSSPSHRGSGIARQISEHRRQHHADERVVRAASACRAARSTSTSTAGRASTPAGRPPNRRGCAQTYTESSCVKAAGLKQRRGDDVAEREKRHRRRHDEERDLPQAGVEPPPQRLGRLPDRRRPRPTSPAVPPPTPTCRTGSPAACTSVCAFEQRR